MRILTRSGLLVFTIGVSANASNILEDRTSDFFLGAPAVTLQQAALGKACSSSISLTYELPCNPSFLPVGDKRIFATNFYLGDDYKTIYKNAELINGDNKTKLAQAILDEPGANRMDSAISVWLRTSWFGLSFTPYRYTYFSSVENKAYPYVSLHGLQERSLVGQLGGAILPGFNWGAQFRGVERKFVNESFYLFDAISDLDSYLIQKKQRSFYFEPGLSYFFESALKPRVSLMISNIGWSDTKFKETAQTALVDLGIGINPSLELGTMDLSISYRGADGWKRQEGARVAAAYRLGMMSATAGYDFRKLDVAVNSGFGSVNVGILYERTRIEENGGYSNDDAVYTEFRFLL